MSAKVRISTLLALFIGLSITGVETQDRVAFTAATGLSGSKSVLSGVSLTLLPQVPFSYVRAELGPHSFSTEIVYITYSMATAHQRLRYSQSRSFYQIVPRHAFTYWRDPFRPPWGPHWTKDPWAPFWDGYWDEPRFDRYLPANYPSPRPSTELEAPDRTAVRRPSAQVRSPWGYDEGTAKAPDRRAAPGNVTPPSRWPVIPALDSEDPKKRKRTPRAEIPEFPPSDLARPESGNPRPGTRKSGRKWKGILTRSPRPSDRIEGVVIPQTEAKPRLKPKNPNRSPYPRFDRSPQGVRRTPNNSFPGRTPFPKSKTRPEASPRSPQLRPIPKTTTRTSPSPPKAPKAQTRPRIP